MVDIISYSSEDMTMFARAYVDGSLGYYFFNLDTFAAQVLPNNYRFRNSDDGQYAAYIIYDVAAEVVVHILDPQTQETTNLVVPRTNVSRVFGNSTWSPNNDYLQLHAYNDSNVLETLIFERETGNLINTINNNSVIWISEHIVAYIEESEDQLNFNMVTKDVLTGVENTVVSIPNSLNVYPVLVNFTKSGLPIVENDYGYQQYYVVQPAGWFDFLNQSLDVGENYFSAIAVDDDLNISQASSSITVVYHTEPLPDLSVILTATPELPIVNRAVNINLKIENLGDLLVNSNSVLTLNVYDENGNQTQLLQQTVSSLEVGQSSEFNIPWQPTLAEEYILVASIDEDNEIIESNETNNIEYVVLEVLENALPKLTIELDDSALGSAQFANNENLQGTVTITNPGNEFNGRLLIDIVDQQGNIVEQLADTPVLSLQHSLSLNTNYQWFTGIIFSDHYTVRAQLFNDDDLISQIETEFEVIDALNMLLGLSLNASSYYFDEDVNLSIISSNNSLSSVYAGGTLITEIISTNGDVLFTSTQTLNSMLPGERQTSSATWNV